MANRDYIELRLCAVNATPTGVEAEDEPVSTGPIGDSALNQKIKRALRFYALSFAINLKWTFLHSK
ncbi:hypothetical protein [Bartonella australis]|uniref:hypothetical protein n=1 Tax=Bartonella australis TaxID=388640 RepID=UPI00034625EA|nr:hypothetical protein [Bartonella australis]